MNGRTKTKAEKDLHNILREHGCAVCRYIVKPDVEQLEMPAIHHIEGKTKPDAHKIVIPLCKIHHQYGVPGNPSFHANGTCGGRAQFEATYQTDEYELMALCEQELGYKYSEGES